jgi:hypothetical protein
MKKLFRQIIGFFVVAAIVSLLTGCSREADVEIFNNTASAITIMLDGHEFVVEKDTSRQLLFGNLVNGIVVSTNGKTSIYKSAFLNKRKIYEFLKHSSKADILTLQLNSDGLVYVVAPDTKLPANQYPEQPENFPLQPSK